MKKILSSPKNKKRMLLRYFSVPLPELLNRENVVVPNLVTNLTSFICQHGLQHEGVFRMSGSARVVEQLRLSYDHTGDADLYEVGDVMAVASLLKLFLRELPGAVVPEKYTQQFVRAHQECSGDIASLLPRLLSLLADLPAHHHALLKYLLRFLVVVSLYEPCNKMSPVALGIVFGPNLFKVAVGLSGLMEQGVTNHIVTLLIKHYDDLLLGSYDVSPYTNYTMQTNASPEKGRAPPPPRPPPLEKSYPPELAPAQKPQPQPRRTRCTSAPSVGGEFATNNATSSCGDVLRNSHSDEDIHDSLRSSIDQGILDSDQSDAGLSIIPPSPRLSSMATELVEETISSVVALHLFGDSAASLSSEDSSDSADKLHGPVPAPRKKSRPAGCTAAVENGVNRLNHHSPESGGARNVKCAEDFPSECAGDGAVAAPQLYKMNGACHAPKPRNMRRTHAKSVENSDTNSHDSLLKTEGGCSGLGMEAEIQTLQVFKKARGPHNRRAPTRSLRRSANSPGPPSKGLPAQEDKVVNNGQSTYDVGEPRIGFLDLHPETSTVGSGEGGEVSPSAAHKPYVPPLDLSILHEHGDGSDPILAEHGPSLSMQKTRTFKDDDIMLSPRMAKLKKKINVHHDTNVPPSPPNEQTTFSKSGMFSDDDQKTYLKKIQLCKRKVKLFEETFEDQHGYRPSHSDKAGRPEMKKCVQELARARKDLYRVKESAQCAEFSTSPGSAGSDGSRDSPTMETDSQLSCITDTRDLLEKRLHDSRALKHRPEELSEMGDTQIQDEKSEVQMALLHYENVHGRPNTRRSRQIMRPLYDRYRSIKRLLSKPSSPLDKPLMLLDTVPEHEPLATTTPDSDAQVDGDDLSRVCPGVFMVTRQLDQLAQTLPSAAPPPLSDAALPHREGPDDDESGELTFPSSPASWKANLHTMTIGELCSEQQRARSDKKRLRKLLFQFETEFLSKHGRRLQKDDRKPREEQYLEYKQVKARLRLLDALLSKHYSSSTA